MTRTDAHTIADFVNGLGDVTASVSPARRGGYRVVTQETGQPPRIFTSFKSAFEAFCGVLEEGEQ